jgi:hypothetical protein
MFGVLFLLAISLSPQSVHNIESGTLTLVADYGRATFTTCRLTAFYSTPYRVGANRLELVCTPSLYPRVDDVVATRRLTAAESADLVRLAGSADLYSGGHVGSWGSAAVDGVSQRLEVRKLRKLAVLIIDGNPSFSTGSRRELLALLARWNSELMRKLPEGK